MTAHVVTQTLAPFVVSACGFTAGWLMRSERAARDKARAAIRRLAADAPSMTIRVHPDPLTDTQKAAMRAEWTSRYGRTVL